MTDARRSSSRPAALRLGLGASLALLLLATGCGDPVTFPQTTFSPRSDFALEIDFLWNLLLWSGAVVFVLVEGVLIFAAIRYRRKSADDPLPPQFHGSTRIEVVWTVAPVLLVMVIVFFSTRAIFATQAPAPEGSLTVEVTGHQYWWEFVYPEFPGLETANELYMPLDQYVSIESTSADVIHSFWIPALGGKRDVVPQHINHLWWKANTTGEFLGQCAELCGLSHANMRMRAFVVPESEFQEWARQQQQPAVMPPPGTDASQGATVFQTRGCAGCHTIRGTSAASPVGPDLTHVGSRSTIAAGILKNDTESLRRWLQDPPAIKPGSLMPNLGLNDDELTQLVAYLQSLK